MSEETENTEKAEAQQEDAPLINVDAKEDEVEEEAPIAVRDEPEESELQTDSDWVGGGEVWGSFKEDDGCMGHSSLVA